MSRSQIVLLIALIASAMYAVRVAYDGRRSYTELDTAQAEQHRLEVDYERLNAERQAQATPLRVEKAAHERLKMVAALPAVIQDVTLSADEAQAAASAGMSRSRPVADGTPARSALGALQ